MRQSEHFKVCTTAKVATAFLCCSLLSFIPAKVLLAQEATTAIELLSYPGTSLGGLTSAEAPMSFDECRKLCSERQGCLGFDHQTFTNQCRLFAEIGSARPNPALTAGTRNPIAGYRAPTPPPGQEGVQSSTLDVEREVNQRKALEKTATEAAERAAHYDPMETVTAFYSALAAADGERASAHVVPGKRGRGPFNVGSIKSFFGAMSQPLTLTGAVLRSRDKVRVSYEYVTDQGRRCRGRADVTTVYTFGKTLISRITALDRC
ncbi:PAN domain-containing protein [Sinorhizobium fredii]|uniref:PAN domain-containing protein n=1 Tax=Rhizobium fredii TaxID=380 RepID=UPI00339A22D1